MNPYCIHIARGRLGGLEQKRSASPRPVFTSPEPLFMSSFWNNERCPGVTRCKLRTVLGCRYYRRISGWIRNHNYRRRTPPQCTNWLSCAVPSGLIKRRHAATKFGLHKIIQIWCAIRCAVLRKGKRKKAMTQNGLMLVRPQMRPSGLLRAWLPYTIQRQAVLGCHGQQETCWPQYLATLAMQTHLDGSCLCTRPPWEREHKRLKGACCHGH